MDSSILFKHVKLKFLVVACLIIWISTIALAQSPAYQLYNLEVPGAVSHAAIVAADFNGDHKIDLAVATMGGLQKTNCEWRKSAPRGA